MKTIPVMYHGERVAWNGKIQQCFKDQKGEEHFFNGIKRVWFGSVYAMTVSEAGVVSMKVKPEAIETKWEATPAEETAYQACKVAVVAKRQSNLSAMKIKRPHENLIRAVNLVKPFYLALSNVDRRRFMDWFFNECSKKAKGKKK